MDIATYKGFNDEDAERKWNTAISRTTKTSDHFCEDWKSRSLLYQNLFVCFFLIYICRNHCPFMPFMFKGRKREV